MIKVRVIIVHFGNLPAWFDIWLASAETNPKIEFHLLTDSCETGSRNNIHFHAFSVEKFNELSFMKLHSIVLDRPYKLCDFRPLYSELFKNVIADCDYWGWGDLDVLYGDILCELSESFGNFDYVSTGYQGESGPLAFLRNSKEVGDAWRLIPDVIDKLASQKSYALDEKDFLEILKTHFKCDICFRECMHDLPARWQKGKLYSMRSGKRYVLHHFGGRLSHTRKQISSSCKGTVESMKNGKPVRIGTTFRVYPETVQNVIVDNCLAALIALKSRIKAIR